MKITLIYIFLLLTVTIYTQELVNFSSTSCIEDDFEHLIIDRIIDSTFVDSTLIITVGSYSNCASKNAEARVILKDDTLYLYVDDYIVESIDSTGEEVTIIYCCMCCFNFTFEIGGIPHKLYNVKLNNKEIIRSKSKYDLTPKSYKLTQNGDTINLVDAFNKKQGLWINEKSEGQVLEKLNYTNDIVISGEIKQFDSKGSLLKIWIVENEKVVKIEKFK